MADERITEITAAETSRLAIASQTNLTSTDSPAFDFEEPFSDRLAFIMRLQ